MVSMHYGCPIMNKSDLLDKMIIKYNHLPPRDVEKIMEKILSTFTETLSLNNRIEIRGFGTFSVKNRPRRYGRNPKTGEKISIPQKNSINFKASKEMKGSLNEK